MGTTLSPPVEVALPVAEESVEAGGMILSPPVEMAPDPSVMTVKRLVRVDV